MKKIISILLALVLATSILQATALASSTDFDAGFTSVLNSLGMDYDTMFSSSNYRSLAALFMAIDAMEEGMYSSDYMVTKLFVDKNMFFSYNDKHILVGFCVDKKHQFILYNNYDDTISYIKEEDSYTSDAQARGAIELTMNSEFGNCFELDTEEIYSVLNELQNGL